jgi:hypothetical protein
MVQAKDMLKSNRFQANLSKKGNAVLAWQHPPGSETTLHWQSEGRM